MTTIEAKTLVFSHTQFILEKQTGDKTWGMKEHVALLVRLAIEQANKVAKAPLTDEQKKELRDGLLVAFTEASAGNASAFRQGLKNSDGTPMFVKKADKVASEYV